MYLKKNNSLNHFFRWRPNVQRLFRWRPTSFSLTSNVFFVDVQRLFRWRPTSFSLTSKRLLSSFSGVTCQSLTWNLQKWVFHVLKIVYNIETRVAQNVLRYQLRVTVNSFIIMASFLCVNPPFYNRFLALFFLNCRQISLTKLFYVLSSIMGSYFG